MITTIKELQEVLKTNFGKATLVYEKDETKTLLKKNRSTKEKLVDEFPTLTKVTKVMDVEFLSGNSFDELVTEKRKELNLDALIKEETEKKESIYEVLSKQILRHKKTNDFYVMAYSIKSHSEFYFESDDDALFSLDYMKENYFKKTSTKDTSILKEEQGLNEPIIPLTLKVSNIRKIKIGEKIYTVEI